MEIIFGFCFAAVEEIMPRFSILVKKITGGKKMKAIICAVLIIGFAIALAVPARALDYHENHPELLPGEKFIGNVTPEQFCQFRYKSKRLGQVAYDRSGRKLVKIDPMGGYRYRPVFVTIEEFKAVHAKKEAPAPTTRKLHFYTLNTYFAGATVTLRGVMPGGKVLLMKFRLERDNKMSQPTWVAELNIPADMFVTCVTVKPRGAKIIAFVVERRLNRDWNIYLLLSSCPVPGAWTRPRVNINDWMVWPAGYTPPANIPADYK